ncbi:MAG: hypothetical protein A2V98_13590 [Planctomycetes bacterium RBG_16_64_12]|nr:MAG: hypothetical protein A2V98_13590 [Planctomycetes bacterium RBG_16_64_12]
MGAFACCTAFAPRDAPAAAPSGPQEPAVTIALEASASPLERFAAEELERYVEELFALDAAVATNGPCFGTNGPCFARCPLVPCPSVPDAGGHGIVLRLGVVEEGLSDQGILLRPEERGLLVGGGSPRAVLWAVYELVQRWGVRYLVHGDVLPETPGPFRLPEQEVRLEPNMRTRCWRLVNDLADGPVSWSLEENQRFLRQIAKMKYNRIFLSFWPCQPFVHYSFRGMEKPAPTFNFGEHFPIDQDTVGREKFGQMTEFLNPDYVDAGSPEELVRCATALAKGILQEARRLGMETGLAFFPFDWPKEFMEVLPGCEPVNQLGNLTAGPGKDQALDDPLLGEMVATIVRAYVETYPEAEYVHISMPEHRGWTDQAERAYEILDKKYVLHELGTFEELCARARSRTSFPGGGQRVEKMLRGDLACLAFFDSLVREKDLLARPGGRSDAKLVYSGVVAELFPLVAKMLPPGGEVLSFIDYTASRQLKQRELLRQQPPAGLPANLIFTLADDNVGVLPQLATGSLDKIMRELRASGWSGFYTRYWTVGDLVPTVHYLAKASWDTSVTPETAYRDLFSHVAGPEGVAPALEALGIIEAVTKGLDEHGLGFGFPVPGMMTKHYTSGGLSEEIQADHARYREALAALEAARRHSRPAGHRLLDYLIGRLVFAVRYLDAAESFGATSRAEKAGNIEEAARHVDEAYAAIRQALEAWADVAEDHGDLGAVALMNKFCYRPIRDKREQLRKAMADAQNPNTGRSPRPRTEEIEP